MNGNKQNIRIQFHLYFIQTSFSGIQTSSTKPKTTKKSTSQSYPSPALLPTNSESIRLNTINPSSNHLIRFLQKGVIRSIIRVLEINSVPGFHHATLG